MTKKKKTTYIIIGISTLLITISAIFIGIHIHKKSIEGDTGMFFFMAVGRTTGCTLTLNHDKIIMKGKNDWGSNDITWIDSYKTKDLFNLENDSITMTMYPVEYIPVHESSIEANEQFTPTPILCEITLKAGVINQGKTIGFNEIFSIYRNENGEYISQDLDRLERNDRETFGKYKESPTAPENKVDILYENDNPTQIKEIKITKKVTFLPMNDE